MSDLETAETGQAGCGEPVQSADVAVADRCAPGWSGNRATAQPLRTIASAPSILDRFAAELPKLGLVGEERAAKLLYLVVTSRVFDRPISAVVKGPSSGGKSFLVETVLRFFPEEAYYALTGMSEKALVYSEEPLVHRMLVVYEAHGMSGDGEAEYFMRSLLSEGEIRYETVATPKGGGRPESALIHRPGPTGLIVTTTQTGLHPENETRMLSLHVTDSAAQTKAIMLALAEGVTDGKPDLWEWHMLQRHVADGERRVVIPFARQLAEAMPPAATRLRRDFGAILRLIEAHAVLHRATRQYDEDGRTIAALDDYAAVRELVADLISQGVGRAVTDQVRETVEAVERLQLDAETQDGVTQAALVEELKLDKATISRRVRVAVRGGYLRNLETQRGRPSRLRTGDPLPDAVELLPSPDKLGGCTVARDSEAPRLNGTGADFTTFATPEEEEAADLLGIELFDDGGRVE